MPLVNRRGALSSRASGFMNGNIIAPPGAGGLWVTGRNNYGQLGLGDNVDRNALVQVGSDLIYKQVSASSDHTILLKYDGTIYATGRNNNGQLGQGNTTDLNVWTQIGTDTDWVQVLALYPAGTLAIKSNGTLWACGSYSGTGLPQPAFPGPYYYTTMTQVGTDTNWVFINGASNSTIAIKSNGTMWGVGSDTSGQLGLGGTTFYTTFTQIGTDTDWQSVLVTPQNRSYAQKTNGYIYATGINTNGELGVGDNIDKTSFTGVTNQQAWKSYSQLVFVGADNYLYYTSDGANVGLNPGPPPGNWPLVNSMTKITAGAYGPNDNLLVYHSNFLNATVYMKTDKKVYLTGVNVYGILNNGLNVWPAGGDTYNYPTLLIGVQDIISVSSAQASFYIFR